MGKYWLFTFEDYYPNGGLNDFVFAFKTRENACEYVSEQINSGRWDQWTNYQIVNIDTGEMFFCSLASWFHFLGEDRPTVNIFEEEEGGGTL